MSEQGFDAGIMPVPSPALQSDDEFGDDNLVALGNALGSESDSDEGKSDGEGSEVSSSRNKRSYKFRNKTKLATWGRWTDEEHELFLLGMKRYGHDWKSVSNRLLPHRTAAQIRSHAQKYLLKAQGSKSDTSEIDDSSYPTRGRAPPLLPGGGFEADYRLIPSLYFHPYAQSPYTRHAQFAGPIEPNALLTAEFAGRAPYFGPFRPHYDHLSPGMPFASRPLRALPSSLGAHASGDMALYGSDEDWHTDGVEPAMPPADTGKPSSAFAFVSGQKRRLSPTLLKNAHSKDTGSESITVTAESEGSYDKVKRLRADSTAEMVWAETRDDCSAQPDAETALDDHKTTEASPITHKMDLQSATQQASDSNAVREVAATAFARADNHVAPPRAMPREDLQYTRYPPIPRAPHSRLHCSACTAPLVCSCCGAPVLQPPSFETSRRIPFRPDTVAWFGAQPIV